MDLVKPEEVFHFAARQIKSEQPAIIANHNLHSLYLLKKNRAFQAFYQKADLVEVDSIPLIAWARLVGRPGRRFHRCTYLDWRKGFWARAQNEGWRVFFVGGQPGVAEAAAKRIRESWPHVSLETHHGYFDATPGSADNRAALAKINEFAPQILFVGMGMPRQETWIIQNYDDLPACVTFPVGAAFDYEAGVQHPCPRWIGQFGGEWLFRLVTNPKLFRRYLVEPWSLLEPAAGDLARAAQRRLAVRSNGTPRFAPPKSGRRAPSH